MNDATLFNAVVCCFSCYPKLTLCADKYLSVTSSENLSSLLVRMGEGYSQANKQPLHLQMPFPFSVDFNECHIANSFLFASLSRYLCMCMCGGMCSHGPCRLSLALISSRTWPLALLLRSALTLEG